MGRQTVLSDEEDEIEVEDGERKEPDDGAVDHKEDDDIEDFYKKYGFIVDEDEQDAEDIADSDWERQRKKKRKKRGSKKNYVFDEDDFEFPEDNIIIGFQSPKLTTKFKRLKKAVADADEGQSGYSDDDGPLFEDIGEEDDDMVPTWTRKVNKKKSKQTSGASSSAIQEAHDIFGDKLFDRYDDRLEDESESTILSNNKTEKDMYIRVIDIPERMQISEESTGPPPADQMSIEEESSWILHQFRTTKEGHDLAILKDDIIRFLKFTHLYKLDVPFIAMYRKYECQSLFRDTESQHDKDSQSNFDLKPTLRWHKVFWAVLELDRKWLLLQKRKIALLSYYTKRFEEEKDCLNQKLFDSITMSLKAAESAKEVDDVDSKFNLHFPLRDASVDKEQQFKKPKRKSLYSICSKTGLHEVSSKFSCSSEEFGLLISLKQMRQEEVKDAKETPEKVASRFTCSVFESPQTVLRGARHMAAVEISCDPRVKKHTRSIFMENALVSTCPTSNANKAIDSDHEFAGIKWLKDKPLTRFDDAQWLTGFSYKKQQRRSF